MSGAAGSNPEPSQAEEDDLQRSRTNPLDPDASNFDSEAYLSQLLKEKSLGELFEVESKMVHDVRRLDSEMQQLVYENYNKFITATDTVRKMKTDFVSMEDQMDRLAENIHTITSLSDHVGSALCHKRDNVQQLARTSRTLKNLEFLFDLPKKLQGYVDRKEYGLAVRSYTRARTVLEHYNGVASFAKINSECQSIMEELKDQLKEYLRSRLISSKEAAGAINLLLKLDEPADRLADEFLSSAEQHLEMELELLKDQVRLKSGQATVPDEKVNRPSDAIPNLPVDILEFVDSGCSGFLSNFGLVVAAYNEMFPQSSNTSSLIDFVQNMMSKCLQVAEERFEQERSPSECSLVVRALDRFYRRLTAVTQLLPRGGTDYEQLILSMLHRLAEHQVKVAYEHVDEHLQSRIKDTRQQLAAGHKTLLAPSGEAAANQLLGELLCKLEQASVYELKTALANLLQFTANDITFAQNPTFLAAFIVSVREQLAVRFFNAVVEMGVDFCHGRGDKAYVNATLIVMLSRFCKNFQASTAGYILDLCDQQLRMHSITEQTRKSVFNKITPAADVTAKLGNVGQMLLDRYVEMEGFALSQLLVKSVETRDWLGCVEPRAVRAVMKRVVEDLTAIDARVGQLFEEGHRKDRSSDSSRRTSGLYSVQSHRALKPLGCSTITSTLGKLWTERIDYFSSVEFNKVSVLTGIVKICLKTLLESVRLRTFGKYGLQQVQVDCHYLQMYLWRFVFDEHLVYCLLDEVVSSAIHRCTEPQLMEPSVVELICERG